MRGGVAFAVATALLVSSPALAERGALTVEGCAGSILSLLPTPLGGTPADLRRALMPTAGLSLRYAATHDLGLGLSVSGEPFRRLVHDDAQVYHDGPDPLPGRLSHSYASLRIAALARLYLAGFSWRAFVEPRAGWSRRFYGDFEHLRIRPEGGAQDYGIRVEPFAQDGLLLSLGLGIEHVWDRMAVGGRMDGAALLAAFQSEPIWQAGLVLYASYDLYP